MKRVGLVLALLIVPGAALVAFLAYLERQRRREERARRLYWGEEDGDE